MKRLLLLLLPVLLLTACGQTAPTPETGRLQIVTTVFPAYDFARAAAGELADVTLLLPPGTESHSYEPTPADILAVRDCDLFIYLGGESDAWVETILSAIEPRGEQLRMIDCVPLLEEETVEGMQAEIGHNHEEEHHDHGEGKVTGLDEHVWTAPANAAAITLAVGECLAELDADHAETYRTCASDYAEKLKALDGEFAAFFGTERKPMVFGDRFPLRYFAAAYDLEYYAAFPGCGTQTEPSAATIAYLTEKVRTGADPGGVVYRVFQPSGGGQHCGSGGNGDGHVPLLPQCLPPGPGGGSHLPLPDAEEPGDLEAMHALKKPGRMSGLFPM